MCAWWKIFVMTLQPLVCFEGDESFPVDKNMRTPIIFERYNGALFFPKKKNLDSSFLSFPLENHVAKLLNATMGEKFLNHFTFGSGKQNFDICGELEESVDAEGSKAQSVYAFGAIQTMEKLNKAQVKILKTRNGDEEKFILMD